MLWQFAPVAATHGNRQVRAAVEAAFAQFEQGGWHGEGSHVGNLGLAYRDLGQVERAREYLRQALVIFEEIKSPSAEQVRRLLAQLEDG